MIASLLVSLTMLAPSQARAGESDYRVEASRLCARVLGKIQDPPASVKSMNQLTRAEGDRWFGSAATAFATLATGLRRLRPPLAVVTDYRKMTSEFGVTGRLFRTAKLEFDDGDRSGAAHSLKLAALHAGRAAQIAQALKLGHCGP
jgi:hypothetical protein